MFSLIVEAAKYILGGRKRHSEEPTIDQLVAAVQDAVDNVDDCTTIADASIGNNHQGFFYRSGTVTKITADYILIDNVHMCETSNVNVENLEEGNKISYMAHRNDSSQPMKICKIISLVDDDWEACDSPETRNNDIIQIPSIKRRLVAKVARREGRNVFVEPANVSINLDKVGSTFVPYVGDWVQLEAMVELDEQSGDLGGDVLQVDKLQPLRSKLKIGNVTRWDCQTGAGAIDRVTVFNKASCEPGYVPCVGDKVITDSIESDQGIYTWRSVTVVPLEQVKQHSQPIIRQLDTTNRTNIDALLRDKHGIVITNDLSVTMNAQEEQQLVVRIENTRSTGECVLNRGCFMSKKSQSQLSLVSPSIDTDVRIGSLSSVTYVFKCHGKFVGTSEELFIFIFRGFKIGRIFRITVNEKNPLSRGTPSLLEPSKVNKLATQQILDQGNYVPGVRPRKSPSFIAVRNGIFRIPQHFWNTVLPCVNEKRSTFESEVAVSEAIPCLSEGLRFDNYTTRFHALLYLEEISLRIDLQRYDMASVILAPHGEYLGLCVPGLAEKRPSLLVGDRAIVCFSWDDSGGRQKYEGFVHQVKDSMVLLKFNRTFHETYNSEECQVSFACSYSAIARCHAAIKLATTNLGTEILFPTRVVEKEPQIDFEVDPREEKVKHGSTRDRAGSLSSISSTTSMTSVSDTSSDATSKSPRISVVERLFHRSKVVGNKDNVDKPKPAATLGIRENFNKYEKLSTSLIQPRNESDETSSNLLTDRTPCQIALPCFERLKKRKISWYNGKLNHHQKVAVRNILKGVARPLPYVIFGPPGTGKTITLCETVLQILTTIPESRLLIATPSNSSANLISERLLDSGVLEPGDLVRLVAHHCLEDDSIPERLLPYCATGDLAAEWSRVRSHTDEVFAPADRPRTNCTMSVLGRHRITVGTCIALGLLHNMGFPHGHFSHILVDEAGQATEPQIMVPLSMIHSSYGQIVLAGDPMQLGPVVNSKLASDFGLAESFLSRLLHQFPYQRDNEGFGTMGYDPRLVTKLCINYRSLPEILELPNSLFYDSELKPRVSGTKSFEAELVRSMAADLPTRIGRSPPAIIFHGVNGENRQDDDSPSWYNPAEATQAYLYVLKLYDRGISSHDIGIITPYRKQVRQIRDLFLELDAECPKVGSVEEFQGQERQVIILSAVRSASNYVTEDIKHALGFVASPRRLNVAITRARALLIILGNPELLSQDPYWRSVLIYCMERDSYTGCNFLPIYSMDKDLDEPNYENDKTTC